MEAAQSKKWHASQKFLYVVLFVTQSLLLGSDNIVKLWYYSEQQK